MRPLPLMSLLLNSLRLHLAFSSRSIERLSCSYQKSYKNVRINIKANKNKKMKMNNKNNKIQKDKK